MSGALPMGPDGEHRAPARLDRANSRNEERMTQTTMNQDVDTISKHRREERLSSWMIAASCFVVLLPITLIARLTGWRLQPWPPGPDGYGPVLAETRAMARNVAGIALSV